MSEDDIYLCHAEPPHRLHVDSKTATAGGILLRLSDADNRALPRRDLFVTNAEMKMGYENVFKACFLCVDRGRKEKGFAIPKSDLE